MRLRVGGLGGGDFLEGLAGGGILLGLEEGDGVFGGCRGGGQGGTAGKDQEEAEAHGGVRHHRRKKLPGATQKSLVAQGIDRVEQRGLPGGVIAEDHADGGAEEERDDDGGRGDQGGPAFQV